MTLQLLPWFFGGLALEEGSCYVVGILKQPVEKTKWRGNCQPNRRATLKKILEA